MGNFEKLSVLVIVVIIVMILVVAIYTWTDNPDQSATTATEPKSSSIGSGGGFGEMPESKDDKMSGGWPEIFRDDEKDNELPPALPPVPQPGGDVTTGGDTQPAPKPEPEEKKEEAKPAGEPYMYTVKSGDTFSEVVMRETGSMRNQGKVQAMNPGLDINNLRIGQQIKMPAKGSLGVVSTNPPKVGGEGTTPVAQGGSGSPTPGEYYVTRPGDTLEKISKRAYRKFDYWGEIWARNLSTLPAPEDIRAGMKLFIPKIKEFK